MSDQTEDKVKRPASQYYWGDWFKDVALQSCSLAARGLWHEMNCLQHQGEPYGHLTMPNGKAMTPVQLANLCKISPSLCKKLVLELEDAGVFSRTDKGVIYSRRMVRDESIRNARAAGGAAGAEHGAKGAKDGAKGGRPSHNKGGLETPLNPAAEPPPSSSSASASSPSGLVQEQGGECSTLAEHDEPAGLGGPAFELTPLGEEPPSTLAEPLSADKLPTCPHLEILALWREVLPQMPQHDPDHWHATRRANLQARWREKAAKLGWASKDDGMRYFRRLFAYIGQSKFLTGQAAQRDPNRRPFVIELEWLILPSNWAKVLEGKFHTES